MQHRKSSQYDRILIMVLILKVNSFLSKPYQKGRAIKCISEAFHNQLEVTLKQNEDIFKSINQSLEWTKKSKFVESNPEALRIAKKLNLWYPWLN